MTRKNQVVFVSQRLPPDKGGNAARIHDIGAELGRDWDVTVLSPPPSYPPGEFDRSWQRKQTETVDGMAVHRLWSWQPQAEDPSMGQRMAYYILFGLHAMWWLLWNRRQYDAVITTTPPISTGAPGLVAAALGTPWVVDVRDLWIDASVSLGYLAEGGLIERISRRFQRLVLHTADQISVTTESLGDSLQDSYGESLSSKLLLVPNGVDVERFTPADETGSTTLLTASGEQTRVEGHGTDPDAATDSETEQRIIYTGNLGSAQDLESCIRAMEHLSDETAVLTLVGRGDLESELRQLAADLGVEDRVEFRGLVAREAVPGLLHEATIGVAPLKSTDELAYAMPTKVYEYMASGLPTLVTGRGEIEQFVEDSGGGVHVENDPEQIAKELELLLSDQELHRELATHGRKYVDPAYDRKTAANKLSEKLGVLVDGTA